MIINKLDYRKENTPQANLFKLTDKEKIELYECKVYSYYANGACEDEEEAVNDIAKYGQSWVCADDIDYVPTQEIRNKIGVLLDKQKRFMFGIKPEIKLIPRKPIDAKEKEILEGLRMFLDDVLDSNHFWKDTMDAFLSATKKKRVLLRVEANRGEDIAIFYDEVEDFHFTVAPRNYKKLESVELVCADPTTYLETEDRCQWYKYTYYMNPTTNTCWLKTELFADDSGANLISETDVDTLLSRIPCWVITNSAGLKNIYGTSDVKDLMRPQDQYNRKISDFADALRFQMFGETYIIDGDDESTASLSIAPNAVNQIRSVARGSTYSKASVEKKQSSFTSSQPVQDFLQITQNDMYEKLSMPLPEEIRAALSGKALRFLYTDLIARCNEKWNDWEDTFVEMIKFIVEACKTLRCYINWDPRWDNLDYTIAIKHTYPIPEDEETRRRLELEEVNASVRSRKDYIKNNTEAEDVNRTWIDILDENVQLTASRQDSFDMAIDEEQRELNSSIDGNIVTNIEPSGTQVEPVDPNSPPEEE